MTVICFGNWSAEKQITLSLLYRLFYGCTVLKLYASPLFCCADEGWLHKAVEVEGQLHIIEELQVFEEPQPVNNLRVSTKQVAFLIIINTHAHTHMLTDKSPS